MGWAHLFPSLCFGVQEYWMDECTGEGRWRVDGTIFFFPSGFPFLDISRCEHFRVGSFFRYFLIFFHLLLLHRRRFSLSVSMVWWSASRARAGRGLGTGGGLGGSCRCWTRRVVKS